VSINFMNTLSSKVPHFAATRGPVFIRGVHPHTVVRSVADEPPEMYGPPQDCKGSLAERQVCANVFGLEWRLVLLAMMSCARVCPSKSVGHLKTIFRIRLQTRRYDCSFVLATPMQTPVGNFSRSSGPRCLRGDGSVVVAAGVCFASPRCVRSSW
jgi:hypothetical protein